MQQFEAQFEQDRGYYIIKFPYSANITKELFFRLKDAKFYKRQAMGGKHFVATPHPEEGKLCEEIARAIIADFNSGRYRKEKLYPKRKAA